MDFDKFLETARSELDGFANMVAAGHNLIGELRSRKAAIQEEIAVLEDKKASLAEMDVAYGNKRAEIKKVARILDGLEAKITDMKTKKQKKEKKHANNERSD